MKTKNLACLILFCCFILICSVSAGNFTNADTVNTGYVADTYTELGKNIHYDLSEDAYAVTQLQITVYNRPSTTDFTLYMLDSSTHTGSIIYSNLTAISCDITLILDGNTKYWRYYAPGGVDVLNTYLGTYATNTDTGELGILLAEEWLSLTGIDNYVFSPDSQVANYPISAIDITASGEVNAIITYANIDTVQKNIKNEDDSILAYASKLYDFVITTITLLYEIMSVFVAIFVKHYFEIFVLYECVVIAYTADQYRNRDIIAWFKKFMKYQIAFVYFIFDFINIVLEIFSKIVQTLIKWWS